MLRNSLSSVLTLVDSKSGKEDNMNKAAKKRISEGMKKHWALKKGIKRKYVRSGKYAKKLNHLDYIFDVMKKSKVLGIRLRSADYKRICKLGREYGIPNSTVCAVIVHEWLLENTPHKED